MTCQTGKLVYRTRRKALRGLERVRNSRHWNGRPREERRVYRCSHCGFWHLTHKVPVERAA